jgi:hypothetical protein
LYASDEPVRVFEVKTSTHMDGTTGLHPPPTQCACA